MKTNRLKELVDTRSIEMNRKKTSNYWKPKFELKKLAEYVGVHFSSAYSWYRNKHQPEAIHEDMIIAYYNIKRKDFYNE